MVCSPCLRRSAVLAAVAPAIARLGLRQHSLLSLLALPAERLLRAARVEDPGGFLRGLQLPALTDRVPTAICRHDRSYPLTLRQLPSAPAVLYGTCTPERLGELFSCSANPKVGIVGSRGLNPYAKQITFALARDLARAGVTVVSGVNEGPEGIAHQGALDGGGATIAVMCCPPDLSHLTWQHHLQQRIRARGTAISEFPPGFFGPQRWSFYASQRIIAALADVLVVVEAGGFTCASLTTKIATELGRDTAVVPGRVTDPGGHRMLWLLRDGAHPVANAEDVLEVIHGAGARGPGLHDPAMSGPALRELADGAGVRGPTPLEVIHGAGARGPAMSGAALRGVAA
jgi:DNA processing protein